MSMSYEEAAKLIAGYFLVSQSTRCIQELFETDSRDAAVFYEQAQKPVLAPSETILVVQADGKGVAVVLDCVPAEPASPGKKKGHPSEKARRRWPLS